MIKNQRIHDMDQQMGFSGAIWQERIFMYDCTIVVLYECPSAGGEAYYTQKANYGLNLQVSNINLFTPPTNPQNSRLAIPALTYVSLTMEWAIVALHMILPLLRGLVTPPVVTHILSHLPTL